MAQKQKTSKSFEELGNIMGNNPIQEPKSLSNQEPAMNFYSFLHKRKRFYENDVVTTNPKTQRETIHHKKFDIKKINIEDSNGKKGGDILLADAFKEWQKTPFYQQMVARHHDNAFQLTGGNLLPKLYDGKQANDLLFTPDWRLAIGLGSGSVFETSMSLHHIHGFPYIPSSAVKGVLRSYLITTLQGFEPDSEALLFRESKTMCDIFGCGEETLYTHKEGKTDQKTTYYKKCFDEDSKNFGKDKSKYRYPEITEKMGDIIFFDAYPTESPVGKIKADIMNPHYPNYYGYETKNPKFQPPADYQNPVPIIFLTVENLKFQFMVGLRKGVANEKIVLGEKSGEMLEVVSQFLKDALQNHGIGAKTAVGYGYMKNTP